MAAIWAWYGLPEPPLEQEDRQTPPVQAAAPHPAPTPTPPVEDVQSDPSPQETPILAQREVSRERVLPTPPAPADPEPDETPPATGLVIVEGEVFQAALHDEAGAEHPPGALPPGVYDLEVALTNGTTIRREGLVKLEAGQTVRVRCLVAVENCRTVE